MVRDFLSLMLELQLAGSAAILAVVLLRTPVRASFGPGIAYALWAAVPLAALGVLIPARAVTEIWMPAFATAAPSAVANAGAAPGAAAPVAEAFLDIGVLLVLVWAAGCVACALAFAVRQIRFERSLGRLTPDAAGSGVWFAQTSGAGPLLLGVLRPRIVAPADFRTRFTADEQAMAIAHEDAHRRAGDPVVIACVAAARCLFWFNPLVHRAAQLLRIDQETARDAAVAGRCAASARAYGETLLKTQLRGAPAPLACAMPSMGGRDLRTRLLALRAGSPGRGKCLLGGALAAVLCAGAGLGAWAAQPARVVPAASTNAGNGRVTGAELEGALLAAARRGDTGLARMLLESGADPDAWVPGDPSALMRAVRRGDAELAGLLLAHGADPDFHARGDGNALIAAVGSKRHNMIDLLLDRGANVNAAAPGEGSALTVASAIGEVDIIEHLIERGADVNGYVPGDETPMINAARNGEVLAMRALVDNGADINLSVAALPGDLPQRRSPLGEARRYRQAQAIAYLESLGAQE